MRCLTHTVPLILIVSDAYWPSSSLSNYTEEHMVFRMMDNHKQHSAFQLHSATTTRREISVNQLGTNAGVYLFVCVFFLCKHLMSSTSYLFFLQNSIFLFPGTEDAGFVKRLYCMTPDTVHAPLELGSVPEMCLLITSLAQIPETLQQCVHADTHTYT